MSSKIWDIEIPNALNAKFFIPAHINACAVVAKQDLFNGPTVSIIPQGKIELFDGIAYSVEDLELAEDEAEDGDLIVETFGYSSPVYDALTEYLASLPREVYYDAQSGEICEKLPEYSDEDENELFYEDYYTVSHSDIVKALFGSFFAREFPN